jgi:hypothetical protein
MKLSNFNSGIFLLCLLAISGGKNAQAEIPGSTLISIRDGYEKRVADFFDAQKGKAIDEMVKVNWNAALAFAYPQVEYAAAQFWLDQNNDAANKALDDYAEYFINNPQEARFRFNFNWHSQLALRLIGLFGSNGTRNPGLLKPETEKQIMEAVWLNCKGGMRKGEIPGNTMTETYTSESNTWYIHESENLHAQSFTTRWTFALLAKDMPDFKNRKYDDGHDASWHYEKWNEYLKMYFAERAKKGLFVEMMSRDYNEKTLKGMFNIYDFTRDPVLKRKVANYLNLFFTYWGQEQIDGISGGGKARLYSDIRPSTSWLGYLFFGIGKEPLFETTILDAATTTYRPPLMVIDIACDVKGRGIYEVRQRAMGLAEPGHNSPPVYQMRTDFGGIVRYSYCTPDFIIGTAMFEARPSKDWALISSQNQSRGVIFSGNIAAGILPQCEKFNNNRLYNSMWSVQRKGTQICQKLESNSRAGRTMVWFSAEGLSVPIEEKKWVFAESQGAYAAVRVVDGGYTWEDQAERIKGKWLVCDNEYSPVILEVEQKSNYKSFEDFQSKIIGNAIDYSRSILSKLSHFL